MVHNTHVHSAKPGVVGIIPVGVAVQMERPPVAAVPLVDGVVEKDKQLFVYVLFPIALNRFEPP